MRIAVACLLAALPTCSALAQTAGKASARAGMPYALYEGAVKFVAPAGWPAIMQKTEGTPQFVAFLVKDLADAGSGESAQVSVEAKLLNDATVFASLVNAATDKAKQTQGYEARGDGNSNNALHYVALNGKQRYEYREAWYLTSKIFVHVHCARPLFAATTAEWTSAYESGCAQVLASAAGR